MNKNVKKIYGIIGDPVKHSKSPAMHNAAFKKLGINAQYELFPIKENELETFFNRLRSGEIWGINITIPYKEKVQPYLDSITPLAKEIGAVNLIIHKDNQLYGDNTDGPGYLASLIHETHFDSKHENIMVIGAGGASKAICNILCDNGVKTLTVVNRTLERAIKLVGNLEKYHKDTNFQTCALDQIDTQWLSQCHLLVNTTSLGMSADWPNLDFLTSLNPQAIVSDIVYTPRNTPLLAQAQKRGHPVHHGDGMLLYQGVIAFERFTGEKAPIETMKQALMDSSPANP